MNTMSPLLFEGEHLVRMAEVDSEPWFVAADVCRVLDIGDTSRAVEKLDEDEKGTTSTRTLGGAQQVLIINESGLYTLVLRCRDATTPGTVPHRFRKWVTSEVLPALRRTGSYTTPKPAAPGAPARVFPVWPLDELRTKRNLVETSRMLHGIEGARWMAEQLGFPTPPTPDPATRPQPRRPPVEAWWHGRLMAGTTRRVVETWERLVAIDHLFLDYCAEIGEHGPAGKAYKAVWGVRFHRLVPGITKERLAVQSSDTGWRQRFYRVPSLADARALFCAVTGEAPTWPKDG